MGTDISTAKSSAQLPFLILSQLVHLNLLYFCKPKLHHISGFVLLLSRTKVVTSFSCKFKKKNQKFFKKKKMLKVNSRYKQRVNIFFNLHTYSRARFHRILSTSWKVRRRTFISKLSQ